MNDEQSIFRNARALCLFVFLALGAVAGGAAQDKPVVFVSIPPQAWLVKRLAGEAVEVQTLLPAGADPHTYEPTSRQIRKLAGASLYLTVGMPFEAPLASRAAKLSASLKVAAMDAGIAKREASEHDHDPAGHACGEGGDPHIWLSPRLLCAMASNTVAALDRALPQGPASRKADLERTVAEIRGTDEAVREKLRNLKMRTWVVYHPSWRYFAEEYGLTLLAVEEDGKAPSAKHLADLISKTQSAGVKLVFTEPQYDKRSALTLSQQVGARLDVIDPLQEDWPALMREVAKKLAACQPPPAAGDRR